MKKLILLVLIIMSAPLSYAYYDMNTPVEGASIANNELQFLVIQKSYKILSPKTPTCSDYKVKDTQVLHYPYDVKKNKKGKFVKGYWEELWTINACGQAKQLPVTFFIKKNGTQFQIDSNSLQ